MSKPETHGHDYVRQVLSTTIELTTDTSSNTFLAGAIQFVIVAQVPQRFVTVNSVSPLSAAARLLSFGAMIPIGSVIGSAFMGGKLRIAPCYIVLAGAILELIGVALLSQISTAPEIDSSQYGFQVLAGLGTGMINAALIILTPYLMEKRDLGKQHRFEHICLFWY